jgi:SAM-dependent methyltransferase
VGLNSDFVELTTVCRLCSSDNLDLVLSLGTTPLANDFRSLATPPGEYAEIPLDLLRCHACQHVQLAHVVSPQLLFSNYAYVSGTSSSFVEHFKQYAEWISSSLEIPKGDLILEIGSNDCTLLSFLADNSYRCIGIDPAENIVRGAESNQYLSICSFFDQEVADEIRKNHGEASLIIANNVFAHIKDLSKTIELVSSLLKPSGFLVFEVSYLLDVIEKTLFDTIYHEHLDYHSVSALVPFLARYGLDVVDVIPINSHGGSIRVVAQFKTKNQGKESVALFLAKEKQSGLDSPSALLRFSNNLSQLAKTNQKFLLETKSDRKSIVGFGAPAKMTTLTYFFGITTGVFEFIVDDSPLKQNTYAPGGHTKVLSSEHLYDFNPDFVYILAWNFADSIKAKHRQFENRFVTPVPFLQLG